MREAVKGAERTGLPVWRHKPPFSVEVGGNEGSAHVATKAAAALFIIGPKGAAVKQVRWGLPWLGRCRTPAAHSAPSDRD